MSENETPVVDQETEQLREEAQAEWTNTDDLIDEADKLGDEEQTTNEKSEN
jgi:hypothetical protein